MSATALSDIQSKIAELEERITALKITESVVSKLYGKAAPRGIATPAKRGRPAAAPSEKSAPKETTVERIRYFLKENGPSSAKEIAVGLGLEGRAVSFTLQALKRASKAKIVKGKWSTARRRLVKPETESAGVKSGAEVA